MSHPESLVHLSEADARAAWGDSLQRRLAQARGLAAGRLGIACDDVVRVTTFADQDSFVRYLGARPTEVIAVTRVATSEIVILRPAYNELSDDEQLQVLTHEMTHFLLGRRVGRRLPAWLDEGVAMLTAGERPAGGAWRVAMAATLGDLIPLQQLDYQVAVGGRAQELAYGESLAATRFLLARDWPAASRGGQTAAPLAQALTDPARGGALRARLWDPAWRDALMDQWKRSLDTPGTWLAALSGSGVLWFLLTLLFLVAYWRRRRMNQLAHRKLAASEAGDAAAAEFEAAPEDWGEDEEER